jgi:DNA-directed RNA polymerase I, II, and III subunit RPABC1
MDMDLTKREEVVRTVCKELLYQRGFSVTEEDKDKIVAKNEKKIMGIFFSAMPKFNTERAHEYITMMDDLDIHHGIIVYRDGITSSAKKVIENLPSHSLGFDVHLKVELFNENELTFNITKHHLQPKFESLGREESKAFKKQFGVKFPAILTTDPVVRFYGWQSGLVIKITRKSGYVAYRIVK